MADKIIIFDTTLRDGEQSPGISLGRNEKIEIAEQLARLGVDYIEAGFPVASEGDFEAVASIAKQVQGPTIAALARAQTGDIERSYQALKFADKFRIHVFISTSPSHMEHMLHMSPKQVKEATISSVALARQYTEDVEFSPQDATRTDLDFLIEILQSAVDAGATTLNIPDTVGYAIPQDFAKLIKHLAKNIFGEYVFSTHCHNDLGLAVANSLAGISAGARQVEVCVNGLGERAGNAALEELVMALKIRPDQFDQVETNINTEELARTSRLVSRLTGYHLQFNKAVVGRNAFAHESGIHQHGVLAERTTYEIIDASKVGQSGAQIILGKHSGRHAFAASLEEMGVKLSPESFQSAFERFKELADRKVNITPADLEAIVAEEIGVSAEKGFLLESFQTSGGTNSVPTSKVVVSKDGTYYEATGEGDGMVDATCKALKEATKTQAELVAFNVSSVTGGVDSLGDVVIQLQADGVTVSGRGVSTDIVEASARAYLSALNRLAQAPVNPVARR